MLTATHAATYYVDAAQPDDDGDGVTWETAKKTIGAGISVSTPGDTILVKYGIYLLSGTSLSLTDDRCLTSDDGTHATWESAAHDSSQCIIDAGYLSRVFEISGVDVTDATVIRGFMITGGDASDAAIEPDGGGGILIADGADPIVENCWIRLNQASTTGWNGVGGGICVVDHPAPDGTAPTIQHCDISENLGRVGGRDGYGGGIYVADYAGPVTIVGNSITENTASTGRGGFGGGVCFYAGASGEIRSNTISYNIASGDDAAISGGEGGGIYISSNDDLIVWENTITHNTASTAEYMAGSGGGIWSAGANSADIWNNEIAHNVSALAGSGRAGGVYIHGAAVFRENVISNNIASASDLGDASNRWGEGGGVFGPSGMWLLGNTIASNTASLHGEGRGGGLNFGDGGEISRNLIYLNVASAGADGYGGGAYYNAGSAIPSQQLRNNTFYRNANTTSGVGGGDGSGFYHHLRFSASANICYNNIFSHHDVENSDMVAVFADVPVTISHTCFHENPGGDYNVNVTSENDVVADPRMTDPDNADFSLLYDSPAIDAGHPDTEVPENGGWRVDIGALEYTGMRLVRAITGPGEYLFGGQVRAKVDLADIGTLSLIEMIVHPGERHPEALSCVLRWFEILPTGEGATFDLTLSYEDSELNGHDEENLALWRWTGAEWEGPKVPTAFDTDENWLTVSGETSFSDWVIAERHPVASVDEEPEAKESFELANTPNPFRAATTIRFSIPEESVVRLSILDASGRLLRNLAEGELPRGIHRVAWDGCDKRGQPIAAGVYFYRLEAGDRTETRRMLLLK